MFQQKLYIYTTSLGIWKWILVSRITPPPPHHIKSYRSCEVPKYY